MFLSSITWIGFETARVLSLHGCHVVLLCRDKVKGDNAANRILKDQVRCFILTFVTLRKILVFLTLCCPEILSAGYFYLDQRVECYVYVLFRFPDTLYFFQLS